MIQKKSPSDHSPSGDGTIYLSCLGVLYTAESTVSGFISPNPETMSCNTNGGSDGLDIPSEKSSPLHCSTADITIDLDEIGKIMI